MKTIYEVISPIPYVPVGYRFTCEEDKLVPRKSDGATLVASLQKFIEIYGLINEYFKPITDRQDLPKLGDAYYWIDTHGNVAETCNDGTEGDRLIFNQGNWRWTKDEMFHEKRKRAAIERVRRYLLKNNFIETEYQPYQVIEIENGFPHVRIRGKNIGLHLPYGRIKDGVDLVEFLDLFHKDLLLIHS